MLCPNTARTIYNHTPVLTNRYQEVAVNSTEEIANTRTIKERTFLSVLTRAVDDSGWLEETEENPFTDKKLPLIIEIIL